MSFYSLIDIKFADPVSAMNMSDKFLIYGTMMGRIGMFSFQDKKCNVLSELSNENITGVTVNNQNCFNVSIGDEEVVIYKIENIDNQQSIDSFRQPNYENESKHHDICDNCYTILSDKTVLLICMSLSSENNYNIISKEEDILVICLFIII